MARLHPGQAGLRRARGAGGRRVTDATTDEDPLAALKRRAKDYAPGDTDLAWTRTTPWRALLASAFDDMAETPTSAEVHAERGNPSAALLAGWLTARLRIKVKRVDSAGPGITAVEVRFGGRDRLRIDRPDGYLATLSRTGITDRQLPLKRRDLGDLLSEELRRLDADQPYADALAVITGEKDLDNRPAMRTLIWKDPEKRRSARSAPAKKSASTKKSALGRDEVGQADRPGREEGHQEEGGGDPQGSIEHGEAHREEGGGPEVGSSEAVARVTGR